MKLIIRDYLATLRERDELDAVVPGLLCELGLNVFSRPGRGTRQSGVDVAAVGRLENDDADTVYLISIKPGDLTRSEWNGNSDQALRPSLEEIQDDYIPHILPEEHRGKPIVIAICFGGDVKEQVRSGLKGYIEQHQTETTTFVEWNGDKLASMICQAYLQEGLVPEAIRSPFRKSLALSDEPDASYKWYSEVVSALAKNATGAPTKDVTVLRQLQICMCVLLSWGREVKNLESSYLSSELTLLHGWDVCKAHADKKDKASLAVHEAYFGIQLTYFRITTEYLETRVRPFVEVRDGLSSAVRSSCPVDVNLKLHDVLGRLSMGGIWVLWRLNSPDAMEEEDRKIFEGQLLEYTNNIKALIVNNQVLCMPIKDNQAIDISLALMLMASVKNSGKFILEWLSKIIQRADLAMHTGGKYPCTLGHYQDLLEHPKRTEEYLIEVTAGTILYPLISIWAALIDNEDLFKSVQSLKSEHLEHSTFQVWYPDATTEEHLYKYSDEHGATLTEVNIDGTMEELLDQVFGECEKSDSFNHLSAVRFGLWPITLVASRHYRIPVPLHLSAEHRKA